MEDIKWALISDERIKRRCLVITVTWPTWLTLLRVVVTWRMLPLTALEDDSLVMNEMSWLISEFYRPMWRNIKPV